MEPLLVPILSLWLLVVAPVDLASGEGAQPVTPPHAPAASAVLDERDADADGVPDAMDACDGTPQGYPVSPNGCSIDTDGDGVSDGRDRCPATLPGSIDVDAAGCSQKDRKIDRPFRYTVGVA